MDLTLPGLVVRRALGEQDVAAARSVRRRVFVDEQGVAPDVELDAQDDSAEHVLAVLDGSPVGAVRMLVEPRVGDRGSGGGPLVRDQGSGGGQGGAGGPGSARETGSAGHLGRLAVLPEHRGRGIGTSLVTAVEELARERGLVTVVLGSQVTALDFYLRLGYEPYGEEYVEAGMRHRHVRKRV